MTETSPSDCHAHAHKKPRPFYRDPLFWACLVVGALFSASYFFPVLHGFRHRFLDYAKLMALPIALGFLAGGMIDYYIPQEYISKYLAQRSKRVVFYATALGFLASACSHGVLALSMELHRKGASGPAVVSFLLASPWANLPITFLLVGFFGWKGLLIVLVALLIAMTTGLIFQILDTRGWIERNPHSVSVASHFSIREDMLKRFKGYRFSLAGLWKDLKGIARGIWGLADMVLIWILIGIVLASLASSFVPPDIFQRYMGPTLAGLLVTLVIATILEVCSEGTSPLAFEIYQQTGALGNAFAFLMAGVVTDVTEIGLVWKNLGKETALWMIGITLPQVLFWAFIFNQWIS